MIIPNIFPNNWLINWLFYLNVYASICFRTLPFGAGRRVCIGETLAKNRLFLFVTSLVQNFEFLPVEGCPIPQCDPRQYQLHFLLSPTKYQLKAVLRNKILADWDSHPNVWRLTSTLNIHVNIALWEGYVNKDKSEKYCHFYWSDGRCVCLPTGGKSSNIYLIWTKTTPSTPSMGLHPCMLSPCCWLKFFWRSATNCEIKYHIFIMFN